MVAKVLSTLLVFALLGISISLLSEYCKQYSKYKELIYGFYWLVVALVVAVVLHS